MRKFIVWASSLFLTACVAPSAPLSAPKGIERHVFDASTLRLDMNTRTNFRGQVALNDKHRKRVIGAANLEVVLNPVSNTSLQWYKLVCQQGETLQVNASEQYRRLLKVAYTNQKGAFSFEQVPVGEYFLVSQIYWYDKTNYMGPEQYGGLLAKRIYIEPKNNRINLTEKDACKAHFKGFK